MWTPLGGQYGSAPSTGSFTVNVAKNEQGEYPSYRYVRIYGSHNSANWTIHFAEVHISTPASP